MIRLPEFRFTQTDIFLNTIKEIKSIYSKERLNFAMNIFNFGLHFKYFILRNLFWIFSIFLHIKRILYIFARLNFP